ncbi:MOSC domain-containing protein [Sciscionella marina]|uniref:MOSC domain-containing protein n=1 Tax=Sciscionella marina TaxID=508770 RepID=UPI00035FB2EE|nr:MOSC N-terminal beta barrel domain-containing protein [Sciscionella marina]
MITIAALLTYPVKGCAGLELPATRLTAAGLANDRDFMVVSPEGVFRSQRRDPRLALIRPEIDPDGHRLALYAEGFEPVPITVDRDGPRRTVSLFGDQYRGIDQGAAAARWLTAVLGAPSRLVRVPPEHARVTDGRTPGTSGYADSCPVHLLSTASLNRLNRRIVANGSPPVPMSRFRPNIVLDGCAGPDLEDTALRITVGEAELGYAKPAIRCAVTTVDQKTAARTGPEPLRTLATYRRTPEGLAFGAKFAVLRPGRLAVGAEAGIHDHAAGSPACR